MRWVFGILTALATAASGCAGGAWLEGTTGEIVPPAPARGYPTAVHPAATVREVAPVTAIIEETQPQPTTTQLNPPQPAARTQPPAHPQDPRLPTTSIAVIPPQYRSAPPVAAPAPAPPFPVNSPFVPPAPGFPPPAEVTTPPLFVAPETELAPVVTAASVQLPPSTLPVAPLVGEIATQPARPLQPQPSPPATAEQRTAEIERLRASLIAALEADLRERRSADSSDHDLPRLEQELRLAYLQAGRLDDAVAGIEALDPPQRDAYKDLMFGLGVWLSPDEARSVPLRSAKVLRSLREATNNLAAASKLELRKLAFCEKVDYYGWYTEFPRAEFTPKQEVILYVEVENFAAEHKSAAGFETELQGRYEILDPAGQIVAERELPLDKEVCRNYRRDYFLAYRLRIPEAISAGRYRLELSIEDRKASGKYQGRKFGQGTIEFTVR